MALREEAKQDKQSKDTKERARDRWHTAVQQTILQRHSARAGSKRGHGAASLAEIREHDAMLLGAVGGDKFVSFRL